MPASIADQPRRAKPRFPQRTRHLDHTLSAYARCYNRHRPHQGLGNRTLPEAATGPPELEPGDAKHIGCIRCQRFLGGLLRHYYRDAA